MVDVASTIKYPIRLIGFIELLKTNIGTLQLDTFLLVSKKIAALFPLVIPLTDPNTLTNCFEFICLLLLRKLPVTFESISADQMTSILKSIAKYSNPLFLLSLPALTSSSCEYYIGMFVHYILTLAFAATSKPKYTTTTWGIKETNIHLTFLNYALGSSKLVKALELMPYTNTEDLIGNIVHNTELNLHVQAWRYNKRMMQVVYNIVVIAQSIMFSQTTYIWDLLSKLLLALIDIHKESALVTITNPIVKLHNEYKIQQLPLNANGDLLIKEFEVLIKNHTALYIQSNMNDTSITESFAFLCVSIINFARDYEDRKDGLIDFRDEIALLEESKYQSTLEQNILLSLSFDTPLILKNLWNTIAQCKRKKEIIDFYSNSFQIFCKLYMEILIVVDDMELVGKVQDSKWKEYNVLKLEELKSFCLLINEIAYKLYVEYNTDAKYFSLRCDVLKILRHLYDRTRHNKIVGTEFWYLSHARIKGPNAELILQHIPHVIPFIERAEILRKKIREESKKAGHTSIVVIRDSVFESTFKAYRSFKEEHKEQAFFKGYVSVTFRSTDGMNEAGVGHGIFKEFLTLLARHAFDPSKGFFIEMKNRELFPNLDYTNTKECEEVFEFLGLIVAKAILEGTLLQSVFSQCFLTKVIGKTNHINDLKLLDEKLYENLMYLKYYKVSISVIVGRCREFRTNLLFHHYTKWTTHRSSSHPQWKQYKCDKG